ncbi:MAG TPA: HD domain-containing phosphohydrolase, partial [Planctomycetaceae bacterium]|nr:HD domain-containing phosphohydrolase [Planctomycetaceae bacterium]
RITPGKRSAMASEFATISIASLKIGAELRASLFEDREDQNILLLASGTVITARLLQKLQERGISTGRISRLEYLRLTEGPAAAPVRAKAPLQPAPSSKPDPKAQAAEPFLKRIQLPAGQNYEKAKVEQFCRTYAGSVRQVEDLFETLKQGGRSDGSSVVAVAQDSINQMSSDFDLFVAFGAQAQANKYPYNHSLQTSMLATAIGAQMDLNERSLEELAMGCLIHDVGMLKLRKQVLESNRTLDQIEFLEITKHPTYTFELVRNMQLLPIGSRMVAYQMHERWNGSGYPCQKRGEKIHPFSRIAAISDVFVALISPRPHRAGLLPARAMEEILRGVPKGLYDADTARGLLRTLSLFPIGSFVHLSDGSPGKVIRTNRDDYTRPVVEVWLPEEQRFAHVIDLADERDLYVERPLAELPVVESCSQTVTRVDRELVAAALNDNWL